MKRRHEREEAALPRPIARARTWGARRLSRALASLAFLGLLARLFAAPFWLDVTVLCTLSASLLLYGGSLLAMQRHRPFALGRSAALILSLVGIALSLWWVREATTFGWPVIGQRAAQGTAFSLAFAMAALLSRLAPKEGPLSKIVPLGALLTPLAVVGLLSFTRLGPAVWPAEGYLPMEARFSSEGDLLFVRAVEGPLFALDPRGGQIVARTYASAFAEPGEAPRDPIQSFASLPRPQGAALAVLVSSTRLRTFRSEAGGVLHADPAEDLVFPQGEILEVAARPDGARIVLFRSPDGSAAGLWDEKNVLVAGPHRLPGFSMRTAFSSDGALLVYVSRDLADQGLAVIDLRGGSQRRLDLQPEFARLGGTAEDSVTAVAFSPDGKELALGVSLRADALPGLVWRVDLGSGKVVERLAPGDLETLVLDLAYSPNGRFLVYSTQGERSGVLLRDLSSGKEIRLPRGERGYRDLVFSPDTRRVVGLRGDEIAIWTTPR